MDEVLDCVVRSSSGTKTRKNGEREKTGECDLLLNPAEIGNNGILG